MAIRTRLPEPIAEESTWEYGVTLVGSDGLPVDSADLTAATLTIYERDSGAIVNDVDYVDLLNDSRATFGGTDGRLTIEFTPDDNVILNATSTVNIGPRERPHGEWHVALIRVEWSAGPIGLRGASHELEFAVVNLEYVPE